jgi:hypothetical protein
MFKEEPIATHWEGCEEAHPECKAAKLERAKTELGKELLALRQAYLASGGKLLSPEELDEEMQLRRGGECLDRQE